MLWVCAGFVIAGLARATGSPLLIVGIQTGTTTSASQESIELANVTDATIDLGQVRLEYFSANPKSLDQPSRTIQLQGTLPAGAKYLLTTNGYRTNEASQAFTATLSAAGGHLRLSSGSAEWDFVGWGTATAARGEAIPVSTTDGGMHRLQDNLGMYSDSGNNAQDFTAPMSQPMAEIELASIIISELLPDPATPATDDKDEYIELHNTGSDAVSLSGYKLVAGPTLSRAFLFTNQMLAAGEFKAFYTSETKLSLGNGGSKVQFVAPNGRVLSEVVYEKAIVGAAWLWDGTTWQWSTTPTPNAFNQQAGITEMLSKAKSSTAPAKKKSPTKISKKAQVKSASTDKVATAAKDQIAEQTPKLHNGVIAGVGSIAVLYGAYEYRNDLATIYRKLRRNRSSGRADRQET